MNAKIKPILRYYGGKARIAPWIARHIRPIQHQCFVDVFGGAANVILTLLNKEKTAPIMVYNDRDDGVVTFFEQLRNNTDDLIKAIQYTPYSRYEYDHAHIYDPGISNLEKARRYYVRSWQGYSARADAFTSWRFEKTSRRGRMNVDDWNDIDRLWVTAEKLKRCQIENSTAADIFERFDGPKTLFYCDPPYSPDVRNRREKNAYRFEFTLEDHIELAKQIRGLEGSIIISHKPNDLYAELYKGWQVYSTRLQNTSHGSHTESVWISPNATFQQALF